MKKIAFVITILMVLSGCGGKPAQEYRTDTGPIRKRFPLLGEFERCLWKSGEIGESARIPCPGPGRFYLKGYVFLTPKTTAELLGQFTWSDAPAEFKPDFPPGTVDTAGYKWQVSEELNKKLHLDKENFTGFFYLIEEKNLIYFHATWGG